MIEDEIHLGIMEGNLDRMIPQIMHMRYCQEYSPQTIQRFLESGLNQAIERYNLCHNQLDGKMTKLTNGYKAEFGTKKYNLRDLTNAGKIFKQASQMLESYMPTDFEKIKEEGIIGIGTMVNHHFIGRTVIQQKLRFSGYLCYELGSKLKTKDFINAAQEYNLDVIGISLMANTKQVKPLNEFKRFLDKLDSTPLEKNVQILIGGQAKDLKDYLSHPRVHQIKDIDMVPYFTQFLVETARSSYKHKTHN